MAVVIETTLGDITVDLYLDQRPVTCLNFLKLCKMKYYNFNLFHSIRSGFIAQTGDPTGEGSGGQSVFGLLEGPEKRFFSGEKRPKIRHHDVGLLSMVGTGDMMIGSQFFFTLAPDLDSLDDVHCVIGEVSEGHEVLRKLNDVICDESHRPYRDVRITHTVVLEDPFNDPTGLRAPSRSPSPSADRLKGGRIAPDEEIDETMGKSAAEIQEMIEEKEAKARATILEIVGDLPDADIAPPENVLFVCKLNPVTTDDDLEIIFSRFGKIVSCEVIRDKKTGDSLQYAFIEFAEKKSCEDAYFKMGNVLIDDRRIHVDFSQSVSKMRWLGKGRGVKYFTDDENEFHVQGETSKRSESIEREYKNRESNKRSQNTNKKHDIKERGRDGENRSVKKRSRSPTDRNTSRNYRNSENNHTRNNVDRNANKDYKIQSNKDSNGSDRKNSNSHRLQTSPSRIGKEDSPKSHRGEKNDRRKNYKSVENRSADRKEAKNEESNRLKERKEDAVRDSDVKERNRNDHYSNRIVENKTKTREDRSRHHRARQNRQDLSSDREIDIRAPQRNQEISRDRNILKDEKNNKNKSKDKILDSRSRDRRDEKVERYERNNWNSGGEREDRPRYKKEDRVKDYKGSRNSNEDRAGGRKEERQNERRSHEDLKCPSRDKKQEKERSYTKYKFETKSDSEKVETKKRKHRNDDIKSNNIKKSKQSGGDNLKTPSPDNEKTKRIKNKDKQKCQKGSKKKRKQSTSSESSSDTSSSSESSSSDDSDYKKKSQRRRKKKYSTSSSSSSSESSSSSSSSSSTESSSTSSSSSDSDNKKKSKKKSNKKKKL